MWWWNEEVKDTMTRKKAVFEKLCRFSSEKSKTKYKRIRNQTRKTNATAMRMEANQKLNNLYKNSHSVFYFIKKIKKGREESGKRRMLKRKQGQLGFIEEDRAKIWNAIFIVRKMRKEYQKKDKKLYMSFVDM